MPNRTTNIIAGILLAIMFFTAFFSQLSDSATMDELAHIPAGYSYLTQKDFRINPEHPPLVKDLSAIPLLFLNLNFPKNHPSWYKDVNSQWWFGSEFLYHSGNNPDQIIFWSRIPMILLLIFLGWLLFKFTKTFFGNKVACLTLILFAFCPTFLAHGRLVTTDVAAALGVVLATYFWLNFLKNPTKKNILFAGLIFGVSMLFKFSLALLIPFFAVITICYAGFLKKSLLKYIAFAILVGIIGIVFIIWPVYQFHILNYPAEKQLSDTVQILESSPMGPLKNLCIWMADKPQIRALGHYLLGLLMATQRTAFGNTVYFMGMISASGWWFYFPVVYVLKIPLAFHILTLIALLWAACVIKAPFWVKPISRSKGWILEHFPEFSMMVFLGIYWLTSISGNLNIGVMHILPTLPFTYILVCLGIVKMIESINPAPFDSKRCGVPLKKRNRSPLAHCFSCSQKISTKKMATSFISVLLGWYMISSLSCFPYYLSYFNEIGGGYKGGYKYVVDSNYDWGQDLKRLKKWVETNNVEKIKIDYFGGGDVEYYLGEKWEKFDPKSGPQKGWLAISATLLQGGKGNAVPGFNQPTGYYRWLEQYEPIARAGTSIFIYHID